MGTIAQHNLHRVRAWIEKRLSYPHSLSDVDRDGDKMATFTEHFLDDE